MPPNEMKISYAKLDSFLYNLSTRARDVEDFFISVYEKNGKELWHKKFLIHEVDVLLLDGTAKFLNELICLEVGAIFALAITNREKISAVEIAEMRKLGFRALDLAYDGFFAKYVGMEKTVNFSNSVCALKRQIFWVRNDFFNLKEKTEALAKKVMTYRLKLTSITIKDAIADKTLISEEVSTPTNYVYLHMRLKAALGWHNCEILDANTVYERFVITCREAIYFFNILREKIGLSVLNLYDVNTLNLNEKKVCNNECDILVEANCQFFADT